MPTCEPFSHTFFASYKSHVHCLQASCQAVLEALLVGPWSGRQEGPPQDQLSVGHQGHKVPIKATGDHHRVGGLHSGAHQQEARLVQGRTVHHAANPEATNMDIELGSL